MIADSATVAEIASNFARQVCKRLRSLAHEALGPGLLESSYKGCLAEELNLRKIDLVRELALPLSYKGKQLDCGYRIDFLVAQRLVLEVKAVDKLAPRHDAQLMTYLKLMKLRHGLLLNFNVGLMKKGLKSIVM